MHSSPDSPTIEDATWVVCGSYQYSEQRPPLGEKLSQGRDAHKRGNLPPSEPTFASYWVLRICELLEVGVHPTLLAMKLPPQQPCVLGERLTRLWRIPEFWDSRRVSGKNGVASRIRAGRNLISSNTNINAPYLDGICKMINSP